MSQKSSTSPASSLSGGAPSRARGNNKKRASASKKTKKRCRFIEEEAEDASDDEFDGGAEDSPGLREGKYDTEDEGEEDDDDSLDGFIVYSDQEEEEEEEEEEAEEDEEEEEEEEGGEGEEEEDEEDDAEGDENEEDKERLRGKKKHRSDKASREEIKQAERIKQKLRKAKKELHRIEMQREWEMMQLDHLERIREEKLKRNDENSEDEEEEERKPKSRFSAHQTAVAAYDRRASKRKRIQALESSSSSSSAAASPRMPSPREYCSSSAAVATTIGESMHPDSGALPKKTANVPVRTSTAPSSLLRAATHHATIIKAKTDIHDKEPTYPQASAPPHKYQCAYSSSADNSLSSSLSPPPTSSSGAPSAPKTPPVTSASKRRQSGSRTNILSAITSTLSPPASPGQNFLSVLPPMSPTSSAPPSPFAFLSEKKARLTNQEDTFLSASTVTTVGKGASELKFRPAYYIKRDTVRPVPLTPVKNRSPTASERWAATPLKARDDSSVQPNKRVSSSSSGAKAKKVDVKSPEAAKRNVVHEKTELGTDGVLYRVNPDGSKDPFSSTV